jgi:SAM-dependent methyltransferase
MSNNQLLARKQAIDLHNEQASLFVDWYAHLEQNPYFNAFTYSRTHFLDFLHTYMKDNAGQESSVLDVGCGSGPIIKKIRGWGYMPTGTEPAHRMLQAARESNPGISIVPARVDELPFPDNSFDVVFAIEVFRYLHEEDCRVGYREAFRTLKPGGYFLFTLSNRYSFHGFPLYYRLKKLLFMVLGKEIHYDHSASPYSIRRQLREVLGENLENVETYGITFAPLYIPYKVHRGFGETLARVFERFDKWISQFHWHDPFAGNLVVVARKRNMNV